MQKKQNEKAMLWIDSMDNRFFLKFLCQYRPFKSISFDIFSSVAQNVFRIWSEFYVVYRSFLFQIMVKFQLSRKEGEKRERDHSNALALLYAF